MTTRRTIRTAVATLSLAALSALAACSDDSSSTSPTEPAATEPAPGTEPAPVTEPAPEGATVTINGGSFSIPASVAAGEDVTVNNTLVAPHTFSEVNGLFSVSVSNGESGTFVAPAAGSYEVVCLIHSNMTGTLVVE